MSLIDRYILKEWAVGFALTMGVILGILVLQNMYDSLPDLLDTGAGFQKIIYYYALALPAYFPAILPVTFLVSLIFSLGTLHRNNEIIAMRAAGAGLLRITRSLWVVGLFLSGFMWYLTASVIPDTVERSRTYLENLEYAVDADAPESMQRNLLYNLGFDNRKAGRLWFMNRFNERAWLGHGVNVHTRDASGTETGRVAAREAYFDDTRGHWVFLDGRELVLDPLTGDPLRSRPFKQQDFTEFDEDPSLMLALHKKPNELSLRELHRIIVTVPPEENPAVKAYAVRYNALFAAPFSCLVVLGIGIPLATSGVRANPMIGISKCMGLFAFFYVLISLSMILGEKALISTLVAAWMPNAVMLGLGVYLFRRAR